MTVSDPSNWFSGLSQSGGNAVMRNLVFCCSALLTVSAFAQGQSCAVQTGAARAHLVELYTSEGCDSCPPAEKWLYTLRQHPGLVGLEFHVTYWDSGEWRDPFD